MENRFEKIIFLKPRKRFGSLRNGPLISGLRWPIRWPSYVKFLKSCKNDTLFFSFIKAFSLLANHMMSNMKIRRSEQRRDALLARLKVDTDQLLGKR